MKGYVVLMVTFNVSDSHVVKLDRLVSSGYFSFLPHEHHMTVNISTNEHDLLEVFHNRCKHNFKLAL